MPLYEYICEEDGSVLELLRPMASADDPVKDPEGRGREFRRRHSTFAAQGQARAQGGSHPASSGTCCPCGKPHGGCGKG